MTIREYEGSAIYYVEDFRQLAFPVRSTGSSLPESLIHRMRDKAFSAERVHEIPSPPIGEPGQPKPLPKENKQDSELIVAGDA